MNTPLQSPRWTDMPEFDRFMAISELSLPDATMVQISDVVHKGEAGVAVTAGNLFGSSTILVADCRAALEALQVLCEAARAREHCRTEAQLEKHRIKASDYGWKLLPNKEKASG